MHILQGSVNFLLSLGAAIFVPLIIIVVGLLVRMKFKDAVSAGITLGVAFSGMTMLISYMTTAITPAAQAMSETVGVSLPVTDGGLPHSPSGRPRTRGLRCRGCSSPRKGPRMPGGCEPRDSDCPAGE